MLRNAADGFRFALSIVETTATIPRHRMERARTLQPDHDPRERAFARTLAVPDLVARVLLARGIDDPERARQHLKPDLGNLHDPFAFRGMERAVARIRAAVRQREPILVHGDYDVDGVAGTVLLLKLFALIGGDARAHIPDRRHGYSFNQSSAEAISQGGIKLCVSVDNGTNACDWIGRIEASGCDVIVTDHHGTTENVARCHAMLNPRLPDAGYPDKELAGCGVAFQLATAVAQSFSREKKLSDEFREFLVDAMTYVALGTIADVAPLRGENRVLVHHGLRALAVSANPGIRALLDSAGLSNRSPEAEDVAFRIAPLLNAAGRMGHASEALALLMARDSQSAQAAAKVLEGHNQERRKVERALLEVVLAQARNRPEPIIVLGGDDWHPGVLGIVAARVAETLLKPTLLVAFDGAKGRGSGRSVPGFDLRAVLARASASLLAHGGHAAAVGFELEKARLDEFRARINAEAAGCLQAPTAFTPDGHAHLQELDPRDVRKLDLLGPFGTGNRRPTFRSLVQLVGMPSVDSRSLDLRFRVAQDGTLLPARWRHNSLERFEMLRAQKEPVEVVYTPRVALWGEDGPVELQITAVGCG